MFQHAHTSLTLLKRRRRFASITLFMIYIAIATVHFCRADDPRVMGGLHVVVGVAHLL